MSKTNKPTKKFVSAKEFVTLWQKAPSAGAVAKELGVKTVAAAARAARYRKQGVNLKRFAAPRERINAKELNALIK